MTDRTPGNARARPGWRAAALRPAARSCSGALLLAITAGLGGLVAQTSAPPWEDFEDVSRWMEADLGQSRTRYEVVEVGGDRALRASSDGSASLFWRRLAVPVQGVGEISWHWKVEQGLWTNAEERTRAGDDYAARLFVAFGADPLSPDARALCYVWAASEPVGSTYRNPYRDNVATVVLRSGPERAGEWVVERRDVAADHEKIFGRPPEPLFAIGIMVDTDDTDASAVSWFDDLRLR